MDAQTLLASVLALLAVSGLGGVAMTVVRLGGGRNPPPWLAMLHGLAAAAALTLLVYGLFVLALPGSAGWALAALVVAGLGGLTMNLGYDQQRRLIPRRLIAAHAVLAVAGVALVALAWTATSTEALTG